MELDEQTKLLIHSQDMLRHNRQYLETLCSTLFGAFVEPPKNSHVSRLLAETKAAEDRIQEHLTKRLTGKST